MRVVRSYLFPLLLVASGIALGLGLIGVVILSQKAPEATWHALRIAPGGATIIIVGLAFSLLLTVLVFGTVYKSSAGVAENDRGEVRFLFPRFFLCAFIITLQVGAFAAAFIPADLSSVSIINRVQPVFPEREEIPRIAYTLFFQNGSSKLASIQERGLKIFLTPLAACRGLTMEARGYASSAAYRSDNEARNIALAIARVNAALNVAKNVGLELRETPAWKSLREMEERRGFSDTTAANQPLIDREPFNRRVEILVTSYGDCGLVTR